MITTGKPGETNLTGKVSGKTFHMRIVIDMYCLPTPTTSYNSVTVNCEISPTSYQSVAVQTSAMNDDINVSLNNYEAKIIKAGTITYTVPLRGNEQYQVDVSSSDKNFTYVSTYHFKIKNLDKRNVYRLPSKYIQSDSKEIIDLSKSIVAGKTNDYDKAKAIHDWVSKNISYDFDNYYKGTITDDTALEALHKKLTVCNGYAKLYAALARAAGIPTKYVTGTAFGEGHAWNKSLINGKWINIDTTWDSVGEGQVSEQYFNLPDAQFNLEHKALTENQSA
jgi:transglutaminase/protease-like cytokinesis protein 3